MPKLNTVLGTLHSDEMGITAFNEHVFYGASGWQHNPAVWFDMAKVYEKCFSELMDFKLIGGRTYVDGSGIGGGRDLDVLVKLSNSTGVHVIASTGFCSDHFIAPHFRNLDVNGFEEIFLHELTVGMGRTSIQAGLVRAGVAGDAPTALELIVCEAAVSAAKKGNVPLVVDVAMTPERVLDTAAKAGLDTSRIIFSHCDRSMDIDRDIEIAKSGAYIAYDNVGVEAWSTKLYAMPDEQRAEQVSALLAAGFQNQLLLSAGSIGFGHGWSEAHVSSVGNLLRYFVPTLTDSGIDETVANAILCENPQRVLPLQ